MSVLWHARAYLRARGCGERPGEGREGRVARQDVVHCRGEVRAGCVGTNVQDVPEVLELLSGVNTTRRRVRGRG